MRNKEHISRPNLVVDKYSRLAEDYDSRWAYYIEATTRETISRISVSPCNRVLDVGCGTGALLYQLGRAYPETELCGIDPVPAMLSVARKRSPTKIALSQSWAEQLPFANESFDLVTSCNMFHYIRQPAEALFEIRRVLRPAGQLVITDWCDNYLMCRICDWYLRLSDSTHNKVYNQRDCMSLISESGFQEVNIERYKINWFWGLMTATATKPIYQTV